MADWIELDEVALDCVVGVTEAEQRTVQPLRLSVALRLELEGAAGGELERSVDYAAVHEQLLFLAAHGRFRLLESLGTAIARLLLAPAPPAARQAAVDLVRLRLRKPAILDGAVPSVVLERDAEWCDLQTRMVPDKTWLDTLVATKTSGAYRAHIEPDSTWVVPPGVALMVLAGRAVADGRPVKVGERLARGEVGKLAAVGTLPATVLAVGAPLVLQGA
ncbi:MAG: dihydroneopterin aldolase [Alphaproteobacteria bacterium]|nr:dihydroneopterin aldolase [Alphaproteobacteria bacterium]